MSRSLCNRAVLFTALLFATVVHASEPQPAHRPLVNPSAPVRPAATPVSGPFASSSAAESESTADLQLESTAAASPRASAVDRVEFVSFQLAYAVYDGLALGSSMSYYGFSLAPLVGELTVRGLGAVLLSTIVPTLTQSQAMSLNVGTFWANVWTVLAAYAINGNGGTRYPGLIASAAGAGGSLLGLIVGSELAPDPGLLAMANSCGFWAGVLAYAVRGPFTRTGDDWKLTFTAIDLASIGGFVGGVLLSKVGIASRSDMLVVDLGGLAGVIAGAFIANQIGAAKPNQQLLGAVTYGGFTLGGLGAGVALARTFAVSRLESEIPVLSIAPMGRDGWGLAVQSAF